MIIICTDEVGVIDLEYAGPNYLAYEIADHFCEFAGVHDVNFDLYPSEDVQKIWIKAYLEESSGKATNVLDTVMVTKHHALKICCTSSDSHSLLKFSVKCVHVAK